MTVDEWAAQARLARTASALRQLLANAPAGVPEELFTSIRAALILAEEEEDALWLKFIEDESAHVSMNTLNVILDWWRHVLSRARDYADLRLSVEGKDAQDIANKVGSWLLRLENSLSLAQVTGTLMMEHPISGQTLEIQTPTSVEMHTLPGVLADLRADHLAPLQRPKIGSQSGNDLRRKKP